MILHAADFTQSGPQQALMQGRVAFGGFKISAPMHDKRRRHQCIAIGVIAAVAGKPDCIPWIAKGDHLPPPVFHDPCQAQYTCCHLVNLVCGVAFKKKVFPWFDGQRSLACDTRTQRRNTPGLHQGECCGDIHGSFLSYG